VVPNCRKNGPIVLSLWRQLAPSQRWHQREPETRDRAQTTRVARKESGGLETRCFSSPGVFSFFFCFFTNDFLLIMICTEWQWMAMITNTNTAPTLTPGRQFAAWAAHLDPYYFHNRNHTGPRVNMWTPTYLGTTYDNWGPRHVRRIS
jgi:hypothetical protein